jgi:hypothetical protein
MSKASCGRRQANNGREGEHCGQVLSTTPARRAPCKNGEEEQTVWAELMAVVAVVWQTGIAAQDFGGFCQ